MSSMNISDEAVEAAREVLYENDRSIDTDYATIEAAIEAAAPYLMSEATKLIRDLTDFDDCSFDHHGGCQSHGYLNLIPGEMCPQADAKEWIRSHRKETP